MKKLLLILCLLSFKSYAQKDSIRYYNEYVIPKEDYLVSQRGIAQMSSTNRDSKEFSSESFLYYNDSIVILYIGGLKGKTDIFKIREKKWSSYYVGVLILCDKYRADGKYNTKMGSEDVQIAMTYEGKDGLDFNNKTTKPLNEYRHDWGVQISFMGHFVSYTLYNPKSKLERIPGLKRKFSKYFD